MIDFSKINIGELLTRGLKKSVKAVAKLKIKGAPRLIVYVFLSLIILAVALFIIAWIWRWWFGTVEFDHMIKMVATLTSTSFIAAIAFFFKALSDDLDGDGIPDMMQEHDGKRNFPRKEHDRNDEP